MLDLPSGTYRVTVVSVELAGTRTDVQVVFEIVVGPHRGARFAYITRTALERPPATDTYPAFARFVAAATGVECGDDAQQTVDENVLEGRELDVTVRSGPSGCRTSCGSRRRNALRAARAARAATSRSPTTAASHASTSTRSRRARATTATSSPTSSRA